MSSKLKREPFCGSPSSPGPGLYETNEQKHVSKNTGYQYLFRDEQVGQIIKEKISKRVQSKISPENPPREKLVKKTMDNFPKIPQSVSKGRNRDRFYLKEMTNQFFSSKY